jgi:hypothetical protein
MAAANACIAATFVAACAVNGIRLDRLEIETAGELDLRGFLALDPAVKPGYDRLSVTLRVAADAPRQRLEAIRDHVRRTSPNVFNLAHAVPVALELAAG